MARARTGPRKRPPANDRVSHDPAWEGRLHLWVDVGGRAALGPGKSRLLDAIAAKQSLSAAAKELGMSYRLAWQHLQLVEKRTGIRVVERQRGGPHGGGTGLTTEGKAPARSVSQLATRLAFTDGGGV